MKANIIDVDLFHTIKDNPTIIYEIKTLLKKVNNPKTPDYIAGFILDFEPFLEQTAKNVRLKKEFACRLDQQTNVISQQWDLVVQFEGQITKLETKSKEEIKDRVATYNTNILNWV